MYWCWAAVLLIDCVLSIAMLMHCHDSIILAASWVSSDGRWRLHPKPFDILSRTAPFLLWRDRKRVQSSSTWDRTGPVEKQRGGGFLPFSYRKAYIIANFPIMRLEVFFPFTGEDLRLIWDLKLLYHD